MKISKVNHARAAVGKTGNTRQGGFIYVDPAQKGKAIEEIGKRVKDRTDQAKRLYNIYNAFDNTKGNIENSTALREIHNCVNGYHRNMKRIPGIGEIIRNECNFEIIKVKKYITGSDKNNKIKEADVDCAISKYLRKSLSHNKVKQGFRNILLVYFGCTKWNDNMVESVTAFLETYRSDYDKSYKPKGKNDKQSRIEQIEKSINNQNMIVQPGRSDNTLLLLSDVSESNNIKKSEKEAFASFLSDYADLNDENRKDMRIRLRRLLVLYFYGADESKCVLNEWEDHEKRKNVNELFSEIDEEDIRSKNIAAYRKAVEACDIDNENLFFVNRNVNLFWIHHFESAVERITNKVKVKTKFKLEKGYLSEKVWKDAINYMSIKYIALGKAVYHFALDGIEDIDKDRSLGIIKDKYKEGISSFEYERIKAEETLQRELSTYVAFAANNLGRATVYITPGNEDFLLYKNDASSGKNGVLLENVVKPELKRNMLQFFGGQSTWKEFDFNKFYQGDNIKMLEDMKQAIYALRNESFHFMTHNTGSVKWNSEAISAMFSHEADRCAGLPRDKFYSNNLNLFYKEQDLRSVLDRLYSKYNSRASQVPSFNSVFVRKNFPLFLRNQLVITPAFSPDNTSKWQSALYYLFKEIYYNNFLQDTGVKELFLSAVKNLIPKPEKKDKSRSAIDDFRKRCYELKDGRYSLAEICQMIMTEQNQQNNKRKVQSADSSRRNPEIFQHYKMLLRKSLQSAFMEYVSKPEFSFIKKPINPEKNVIKSANGFLTDWKAGMYSDLSYKVSEKPELQKWYICGRLINGRQLNLMVGSMRSFIQYMEDIKRRSEETGNPLKEFDEDFISMICNIIEVLDLCRQLCGVFTNELTDYFDDEEDYAGYMKKYLAYDEAGYDRFSSEASKMRAFCSEKTTGGERIGLYFDEANPILNKNVLQAKLFGPDILLEKTIERVKKDEIEEYYKKRDKIERYRIKGSCETEKEQDELNMFMELKNRIELRNIADYGEIVNELLGQLINWSYLRERDLLYFQLGFHYMCMNNKKLKPEGYVSLVDNSGNKLEGAILHQIAALYLNGIPLFEKKDDSIRCGSATASTGGKIRKFVSYEKEILGKEKDTVYTAGMELFENIREHDDIILGIRNYIDHFKYYANYDRSIIDLYSEIHDRFFSYDMKYQKNVANILKNILLRHFVILDIGFSTGKKMISGTEKDATKIVLQGIKSDLFSYNLTDNDKPTLLPARGRRYLEDIAEILVFPSKEYNIRSLVEDFVATENNSRAERSGVNKKRGANREKDINHKEYEKYKKERKEENVGSGIMSEAFKNIKL